MRVAIVHDFLTKIGGAEKVLQTLHKIYTDAPVYTLLYDKKGTKGIFLQDYKIIPSKLQNLPKFIRNRNHLLISKFPQAIEEFDLSMYDLVISSSNSFAHGVITRPKTLHITYCYSPMRYAWDWTHKYAQENNFGFGLFGFIIRNTVSKLRLWDYYASNRTDFWLAISKTVEKRIWKYYRQPSEVIYPPVEIDKLIDNDCKPANYYLIVSRLSKYKNIELAIKVFNKLRIPLIIIGEGIDRKRLEKLAKKNIKFLGWQSDEEKNRYLKNCRGLVFPGEEDFGITPIEAMATGRPVVAYNSGGVTETVVAGKTGEFFDRHDDEKSLEQAVNKIENNYSNYSMNNCKAQAKKFSEEEFVKNFKSKVEKLYKEKL